MACLVACSPRTDVLAADPAHVARPNLLFLLGDQWRAQALGYAGNPDVKTPHLDRLASQSVNFVNAVAGVPVCSPTRASLLTGQRALTHGVFVNDVQLASEGGTLAEAGYDTGYIGKWHLDGRGRSNFIPAERRQGFRYWKALECTHRYNDSLYYADGPEKRKWEGYDAIAETRDAQAYIRARAGSGSPFFLFLSWGPPHAPYHTAPKRYRNLYDSLQLTTRPNVPRFLRQTVRKDLSGYYAHCTALDDCVRDLLATLRDEGVLEETLVVFTAEHGELLGSHHHYKKQQPYDESIRVPMLIRLPQALERAGHKLETPINSEDIMPTLLGLCGLPIPEAVEASTTAPT